MHSQSWHTSTSPAMEEVCSHWPMQSSSCSTADLAFDRKPRGRDGAFRLVANRLAHKSEVSERFLPALQAPDGGGPQGEQSPPVEVDCPPCAVQARPAQPRRCGPARGSP
eukprot:1185653-Pyramimonas_sp.AAC.1